MKQYKMCRNILMALIFVCSRYPVKAQSNNYFSPFSGTLSSVELIDVKQNQRVKIHLGERPLSLFIFLSPECPMCQNYTKTLNELQEKFKLQVNLVGVIPGEAYTIQDITDFENQYHTNFRILIDAKQELTHCLKATVTPQAILLDSMGNLVYMGAIDDWLYAPGKRKLKVSQKYLHDAIEQSLSGELVKIKKTSAFGCKINDY